MLLLWGAHVSTHCAAAPVLGHMLLRMIIQRSPAKGLQGNVELAYTPS